MIFVGRVAFEAVLKNVLQVVLPAVLKQGLVGGLLFLGACVSNTGPSSLSDKVSSCRDASVPKKTSAHENTKDVGKKTATSLDAEPAAKFSLEKVRRPSSAELGTKAAVPFIVFDRIIAKVLDEGLEDGLLKLQAEEVTGAKVLEIYRGALGVRLIQFAPLNPPRDKAAQKKLAIALQKLSSLKYAEGERWMTAKTIDDESNAQK